MGKPTIAELEAILDGPPCRVRVNPDGSLAVNEEAKMPENKDQECNCQSEPVEIAGLNAYIGAKIIKAKSMSRDEFDREFKHVETDNSRENEPGYLVVYPDDYKSWCPQHVFEGAYRRVTNKERLCL